MKIERPKGEIKLKAMCFFRRNGKILVSKGFDTVKSEHFYRPLGGHIDFFETAEEGIRREIQEELGSKIKNLKLVEVIENLFTYQGKEEHEIVFLYSGDLATEELYRTNPIRIVEHDHEFEASWVLVKDILSGKIPLYPKFNYEELFKP
jgi:8-oxo-dGTP pyrophosphatase MutT (NUDIX family)